MVDMKKFEELYASLPDDVKETCSPGEGKTVKLDGRIAYMALGCITGMMIVQRMKPGDKRYDFLAEVIKVINDKMDEAGIPEK
jgi:hypothetical protein